MIYFIKVLNMRKKQFQYVMHYDHSSKELILTDKVGDKQEYFSKESLLDDLNAIIEDGVIDIKKNQIIVGAW